MPTIIGKIMRESAEPRFLTPGNSLLSQIFDSENETEATLLVCCNASDNTADVHIFITPEDIDPETEQEALVKCGNGDNQVAELFHDQSYAIETEEFSLGVVEFIIKHVHTMSNN